MADQSLIEWTDATWNPITGCSVFSPGCANCYAMKLAGTRLQHHPSRAGLTTPTKAGPVWTGEVRLNPAWLDQPLRWKRPRRIFACAHADLFHTAIPDAWIDQVFAVMALAPQHTFQVLTKRARRMRRYMELFDQRRADALGRLVLELGYRGPLEALQWPLPNVWLGVSAEDQPRADERVPELMATPAAVRIVSLEPLLSAVDLGWALSRDPLNIASGLLHRGHFSPGLERLRRLDQVIVGGESGVDARPMHPDWVRQIRDACAETGVPFFFKQWGNWTPGENLGPATGPQTGAYLRDDGGWDRMELSRQTVEDLHCDDEPDLWRVGKKAAGRVLDGQTHSQFPQVRP